MITATRDVERSITDNIGIFADDEVSELTATEFFELVGELYSNLGFVNDVNIKIKGLHPDFKSRLKFRPINPEDEQYEEMGCCWTKR